MKNTQDDLIKLQHTAVTQVGWDIESSTLGEKLLGGTNTTNELGWVLGSELWVKDIFQLCYHDIFQLLSMLPAGCSSCDELLYQPRPPITLPVELGECGELAAGGEHEDDNSLCFTSEAPRSKWLQISFNNWDKPVAKVMAMSMLPTWDNFGCGRC